MNLEKANNYEAAEVLDQFESKVILPLRERIEKGESILRSGLKKSEKIKYEKDHEQLKSRLKYFTHVQMSFKVLIKQHESITTKLVQIYHDWYNNVSVKGKQPSEMMEEQAEMLEKMFEMIYEFIKDIDCGRNCD